MFGMAITRLIFLLFINCTVSSDSEEKILTCSTVNDSQLTWPRTITKSTSKPICINENKEIAFRYCLMGTWGPEPNCSSIQSEVLPECPKNFNDSGNLCYQFTEKSKFPPVCPYKNVVPFETYKYLVNGTNTSIWVPAQRRKLNFMRWIQLGPMYKKEVEAYTTTAPLVDKNCLIFSKNQFVAVSCDDEHVGVCAYLKLDRQNTNLCGVNCLQSDFDLNSKCFCYQNSTSSITANATFEKPYQFTLYKKLTDSTCNIGLRKINGTYQWSTGKEIDYTFWYKDANFDDGNNFGAGSAVGWTMTKMLNTCYIYEKEPNIIGPIISLSFNETAKMFYLLVLNVPIDFRPELICQTYCFTNAHGVKLFRYNTTIQKFGDNSYIQKIQPVELQPGDYWCEMFNYTNTVKIQSAKIFYRPDGHLEFVAFFEMKYAPDENPLRGEFIKLFESYLNLFNISCFGVTYIARVVKIVNLDEDQKTILLNTHFTSTATSETEERQLICLRTAIINILEVFKDKGATLINITSSDYCLSEIKENLTWPTTAINSFATSEEYCFKSDGTPIMRLCEGDFINGAKWSSIEECEIFNTSLIGYKLINASDNANSLDEIYEISKSFQDFNVLDVYLVSQTYSEYLYVTSVEAFAQTINNLLKIDRDILEEAQEKLGATDRLLQFIDHLTIENQQEYEIYLENFALLVLPAKNFTGVVVQNVSGNLQVFKLGDNETLDEIMQIENIESALFLDPDVKSNFKDDDMIIVDIYFNDKFFPQNSLFPPSLIFNVRPPRETQLGPIIICKLKHYDPLKDFCAFWKYSKGSFWLENKNLRIKYPFAMCYFWNFANFAWISSNQESDEITEDLIDLLDSNRTTSEIVSSLERISEEFVKFKPIDVVYTGKILEKMENNKEVDLEKFANTVSNLQQVDRQTLFESQIDEKATDKILFEVDSIVQNQEVENQVNFMGANFIVFVAKAAQLNGIMLLDHNGYLELKTLTGNISIDDIINTEHFDSAIMFDKNLKNQLPTDSKITITLFLTDALFNEESANYKYISKIFGVVLSETEFSGPISILYKHDQIEDKNCVYWNYNLKQPGFWEKDGENYAEPNVVKCDFWHATHFAYLILDQTKPSENTSSGYFLDLITSINCLLSVMGLTAIIVTAVLFKQWRKNTGNQILLNYSFNIIIEIVVFYISTSLNHTEDTVLCTIVGIILHYSIVSQFCWMLVIAILQFRKFVIVLEPPPKYILLKACSCGWILPIFPVATVFLYDRTNYVTSQIGLCYPSGLGLYLGVWLPVALIETINFVLFSLTLYNVFRKKTQSFNNGNDVIYQIRLAVLLFFLLGFTWCFGFLAKLDCGIVFEYLFCMTVTLQGFILFLVFVAFSDSTRHLYVSSLSRLCKRKFP